MGTTSTAWRAGCTSTRSSGRAGSRSPDDEVRDEGVRRTLEAIDFTGELGAHFIIWPGIEGYNYPFQTPYKESWARFLDAVGQAAQRAKERASRSSSSTRTPSRR